ncbi:hypothetical protein AN216_24425 [Streptomyces oceani]|uniref:Uncharacterized protein n=2 Tax=Streptomyces oceani TaxID=1075402 RepID=A0A1E7JVA6_9ACTN|nr:hypothetical protein AN216_24425 [Streptomyces oceani]
MAFSAEELRVLRGALAIACKSTAEPQPPLEECRQLAQDLEVATREGGRLRSFLLADLARHRAALPDSATGYLEQLEDALAAGYLPRPDDLAALRMLCAEPVADGDEGAGVDEPERKRRAELLERGERLAEQAVRARLLVLPGGRSAATGERRPDGEPEPEGEREREPAPAGQPLPEDDRDEPTEAPAGDPPTTDTEPPSAEPARPVPTPAEVFPPRRHPTEPRQEALPA